MQVRSVDPRSSDLWADLAAGSGGSLFTSPPWISALCEEYAFRPQARVLTDAGRPTAGFCWVPIDDLRGPRISSMPFSDRADPIVGDAATWWRLADDALAEGLPLSLRCFDDHPIAAERALAPAGKLAWHGTPLGAPVEQLAAGFSSATRRALRAGERRGVEVVVRHDRAAVGDFHRLHLGLRKDKYRLLAQSRGFFEHIWEAFAPRDAIATVLAQVDGRIVAGALYLLWGDVLYYKFGASLGEGLSHRPNEAVAWAAMRWGIDRGARWIDWGVSDLDQPGLLSFKRKWGGDERRVINLRHPAAWPQERDRFAPVLRELTNLLTDRSVPDTVSARAGDLLYRYFC